MHKLYRSVMPIFAVLAVLGALFVSAGQAQASGGSAVASFGTSKLRLAESWGGASSCVVWAGGTTDCYASNAKADAAVAARTGVSAEVAAAVPACASGWLCLYEHINGGGRRLIFQDEYTQYLGDFGFSRKTSSYRNRQSDGGGLLYTGSGVSGPFYNLFSNTYAAQMGSWNDLAVFVHP